jgi:hypothetical protein
MAHHHSKSKFKCVLCNNLEFHSQLALEGHIYTKHSKENNDLNDLINETRGRYSQPIKLDYKNEASHVNNMHGGSDNNSHQYNHNHNNNNSNLNINNSNHSNELNVNNNNNNTNENYSSDDVNVYSNYSRSRLTDINNIKELNMNNDTNANYGKDTTASTNGSSNNVNNHENNSPSSNTKQLSEQSNKQKAQDDDDDDIIIEETITSPSSSLTPKAMTVVASQPIQKANIPTLVTNGIGGGGGGNTTVVVNNKVSLTSSNSSNGMILNQQLKRIAPKIDPSNGLGNHYHQASPPVTLSHNSNHINRLLPPSQLPSKTSTAFIGTIRNLYPNANGNNNNNNNNNNPTAPYSTPNRNLNGGGVSTHPQLHSHLSNGQSPSNSSPSTAPNTYCELCNARFSNVESYVAHMRNCHPSIPYSLNQTSSSSHQNTKMPYLTSILSSKSNQMIKSAPNGLNVSAISNGKLN